MGCVVWALAIVLVNDTAMTLHRTSIASGCRLAIVSFAVALIPQLNHTRALAATLGRDTRNVTTHYTCDFAAHRDRDIAPGFSGHSSRFFGTCVPVWVRLHPEMKAKRTAPTVSSKKTTKKTTATTSKPIVVKVDAKLKTLWTKELTVFKDSVRKDAKAFDEKYEAIARIIEHEPPLYLAGGCKTFHEFVEKYVHEDDTLVRRWVDVAKRATPEEEALWSPSRLAILLGILRAKSADGELPDKVAWRKLRVDLPGAKGKVKSVLGVEATLAQLREARAYILRKLDKTPKPTTKSASHLLEALKSASVDTPSVVYRDGWYTLKFASYDSQKVSAVLATLDD